MRGETPAGAPAPSGQAISIHSPHARGDQYNEDVKAFNLEFQSTPLMRGETTNALKWIVTVTFQSTPLMRGETLVLQLRYDPRNVFQSTPLMRGETSLMT